MVSRIVSVASRDGLHARPATLFVQAVRDCASSVRIGRLEQPPVDARSILSVMSLGVKCGEKVELSVDGVTAETDIDHLAELLAHDLDEPQ